MEAPTGAFFMNYFWDDIYGQKRVKEIFSTFLNSNSSPQSIILHGPPGVGKDFLANRFIQLLNNVPIISSNNFVEPLIKYVFALPTGQNETPDSGPIDKLKESEIALLKEELIKKRNNPYHLIDIPKANTIKISSIRDINLFLSLTERKFKYRGIIISQAELMKEEVQNVLLKNIEEPPQGIIFILTTSNISGLRETIRSRSWIIEAEPLSDLDIENILIKYYNVSKDEALRVSKFSSGSIYQAVNLINNDIKELINDAIIFLRMAFAAKFNSALNQISSYIEKDNKENFLLFLDMICYWLLDAQNHKNGGNKFYFQEHLETFEKFNSRKFNVDYNKAINSIQNIKTYLTNNYVNSNAAMIYLIYLIRSLIKSDFIDNHHYFVIKN